MDSIGDTMKKLIQLLLLCEELLGKVGENFWANKIKHILSTTDKELDIYLIEEILSWYGGAGSFNDLFISSYNDHQVSENDEDKLNNDLSGIRSDIYNEVKYLLKS